MTHFEIALLCGCLSSAASVLTAWHFHTTLTAVLAKVDGVESNVSSKIEDFRDATFSNFTKAYSTSKNAATDLHLRLDKDAAATLEALEKALEFFHLHSTTLETHAADLKAHAKQYQDKLALAVPTSRSVPPARS